MTRIHHHIESIGRDFTFEEWGKWLDEHRTKGIWRRIVYTFAGYEFNDCDVCMNPVLVRIKDDVRVEVAQCTEHSWSFGYSTYNGGTPCAFTRKGFPTKEDAIREGLKALRKVVTGDVEWYGNNENYRNNCKYSKEVLEAINQELLKRSFIQQTLF